MARKGLWFPQWEGHEGTFWGVSSGNTGAPGYKRIPQAVHLKLCALSTLVLHLDRNVYEKEQSGRNQRPPECFFCGSNETLHSAGHVLGAVRRSSQMQVLITGNVASVTEELSFSFSLT